jgi:hypothetical protein
MLLLFSLLLYLTIYRMQIPKEGYIRGPNNTNLKLQIAMTYGNSTAASGVCGEGQDAVAIVVYENLKASVAKEK